MSLSSWQVSVKSTFKVLVVGLALCCFGLFTPSAWAYENPELLPEGETAIIDLAKSLTPRQEENLNTELSQFETETGWKLRVLTQYDRTPGRAVKDFWGLDDRSIMLVADPGAATCSTSVSVMRFTTSYHVPSGSNYRLAMVINFLCGRMVKIDRS
jgi:hypothetical protein